MTNALVEKINADAQVQVDAIKAATEADVAVVQKETKRILGVLRDESAAMVQKKKDQMELVANAKAKQTAKIAVQAQKRAEIDALFAAVESDMLAESGAAYVARYTKLAQNVLPKDAEVLGVAAPEAKAAETKEILSTLGVTADVQTTAVRAGLIFTTKDGVYDVSFDRMMSEVRPTLEMELVTSS